MIDTSQFDKYNEATSNPYGYLFIDMTQECPENLRYRTNILPCDGSPMMIFQVNV